MTAELIDGSDVAWLQCDPTEQDSVDHAFREAVHTLGGLDALVHAAGLWHPGIPGQIGVEDVRHVGEGGQIINFGSSEGVMGSSRFITGQLIAVDGGWACERGRTVRRVRGHGENQAEMSPWTHVWRERRRRAAGLAALT
jgi:hypothetical protein